MQYRPLGNTGLNVSQLGFGAMRLPMKDEKVDRDLAIPMMHRAFEGGVNYIDTAVGYCRKDSQVAVGEALKSWAGEKIIVSTKNPYYEDDEGAWRKNLEDSLERLQLDTIDIYNHHGMNSSRYDLIDKYLGTWMRRARDEGLIRHICCSFHDSNDALIELVDTGYPEVITLQYNMLDRSLEEGIAHAAEKGVGVVVMGPVGGGRFGVSSDAFESALPEVKRVPELALRFVLANPNVSLALSGMSTIEQVEENVKTCGDEVVLTDDDRQALDDHLARLQNMSDLYCSGCGYCVPCESKVNIPRVFAVFNQARVYGLWDHAKRTYAGVVKNGRSAAECTECNKCLDKCPQNIPIPERLKECHAALTQAGDA
jgi:hypothetical protein